MESTQKMADAMVLKGLTVRKITAKLRDAATISFLEDGDEPGRYKNIEIPRGGTRPSGRGLLPHQERREQNRVRDGR